MTADQDGYHTTQAFQEALEKYQECLARLEAAKMHRQQVEKMIAERTRRSETDHRPLLPRVQELERAKLAYIEAGKAVRPARLKLYLESKNIWLTAFFRITRDVMGDAAEELIKKTDEVVGYKRNRYAPNTVCESKRLKANKKSNLLRERRLKALGVSRGSEKYYPKEDAAS